MAIVLPTVNPSSLTACDPTRPQEAKKREKLRLAAEKKAKKEAEKAAKKVRAVCVCCVCCSVV